MQRTWKKGTRFKADLCFKQAEYSTPNDSFFVKEYAVWPFQGTTVHPMIQHLNEGLFIS